MVKIPIILLEGVEPPQYESAGAACFDVRARHIDLVEDLAIVYLGIKSAIPEGYKVVFQPRSSFTGYRWVLQNSPAQIDSDYRGEWMLKFRAIPTGVRQRTFGTLRYEAFPYRVGDRVAQGSIEKVIQAVWEPTNFLYETERGSGGFGSTGK
jgi:dUTP pyrophosphatase